MVQERAEEALLRLRSGKVLALAGRSRDDFACHATTELFSPGRNTWSPAAPLPHRLCGLGAIVLRDGRVLATGGDITRRHSRSVPVTTAQAQVYHPRTDRWTSTGSMIQPRAGAAVVMLPHGQVLAAGGSDRRTHRILASAEIYNPVTGRWHLTGSMATRRTRSSAVALRSGDVLVAGGFAGARDTATAERYDVARHRWAPAGELRTRSEPVLFRMPNGHVLAIGGGTRRVDEYVPRTNSWRAFPALPQRRFGMQVVRLRGLPLVLGGIDRSADYRVMDTGYLWRPERHAWVLWTVMPHPRAFFGAVRLLDGSILIAGGQRWNTQVNHKPTRYAARYYPR